MQWYKTYHGLPYDPVLAVVARRANLTRAEVLALWVALLDYASTNAPRGSLAGLDSERIAAGIDLDPANAAQALEVLQAKKMILPDQTIADWHKDQGSSTARVQAHRHREKKRRSHQNRKADPDTPAQQAARRRRLMQAPLGEQGRAE